MVRRIRSTIASVIDAVAGPLGWDVLICSTSGQPGIDWFTVRRRPAGMPRARIARPCVHRVRCGYACGICDPD